MSRPGLILAILVFAALCALVGYVLHGVSEDAENRPIEHSEKRSLRGRRIRAVIIGTLSFFPSFLPFSYPFH
jgi:hypothetical protein